MLSCWNYGEFNVTKIHQTKDIVDLNVYSIKFMLNIIVEVLIVITEYSCGNLLVG